MFFHKNSTRISCLIECVLILIFTYPPTLTLLNLVFYLILLWNVARDIQLSYRITEPRAHIPGCGELGHAQDPASGIPYLCLQVVEI